MLTTKRSQLRKNIRKEELEQFFTIKRKELVQGKTHLFRELHRKIEEDYFKGTSMELITSLLTCQHNHSDH